MKKILKNVQPSIRAYLGLACCYSIIDEQAFTSGWVYDKLVDCLEKCLIYGHIRRFAD